MKRIVTALGATLLFSASAMAADVSAPAYDWTGAYLGLQGGYAVGTSKHYTVTIPASTSSFDIDGFVGGATIGANYQINNIVIGAEGDVSLADITGKTGSTPLWGCVSGCRTESDWLGTARLRTGLALDSTLLYLTGGLAFGDGIGKVNGFPAYSGPGWQTKVGWTIGGGIEHAFSEHLTAKLEYLYVDLGHVKLEDFAGYGVGRADLNYSLFRVGVNYKF